jgi:glycerophosphoryl diester phosphodiesterase
MEKVPNIQDLEELISKVIKDTIRIEITDHDEDLNERFDSLDFEELLISLEDEVLKEYGKNITLVIDELENKDDVVTIKSIANLLLAKTI